MTVKETWVTMTGWFLLLTTTTATVSSVRMPEVKVDLRLTKEALRRQSVAVECFWPLGRLCPCVVGVCHG